MSLRLPISALVLSSVLFIGCGGGEAPRATLPDAKTLLSQAQVAGKSVKSASFSGTGSLKASAGAEGSMDGSLSFSGKFAAPATPNELPELTFTGGVKAQGSSAMGGESLSVDKSGYGLTIAGQRAFLLTPEASYEVPAELMKQFKDKIDEAKRAEELGQTAASDPSASVPSAASTIPMAASNPSAVIDQIDGLKAVSEETIAGVATYKIQGSIDPSKFEPSGAAPVFGSPMPTEPISVSAWIGKDDHLVYRFDMDFSQSIEQGPSSVDIAFNMSFNFSDYNEPVTVEAPTNLKPFKELVGSFPAAGALATGAGANPAIGGPPQGRPRLPEGISPGASSGEIQAQMKKQQRQMEKQMQKQLDKSQAQFEQQSRQAQKALPSPGDF